MSDSKRLTRRRFLEEGLAVAGGVVLLSNGLGCATTTVASSSASESDAASAASGGREYRAPLSDFPELGQVGGVRRVQEGAFDFFLVRTGEAEVLALENSCTHRQCKTNFEASSQQFVCPCHGSKFDLEGTPLSGPATEPLRRYPARLENGVVIVLLSV